MEAIIKNVFTGLNQARINPRYTVCIILFAYNVLGITVLGFNRSIEQVVLTALLACGLQMSFDKIFKGKISFPVSALTTAFGLSILVNYGHSLFFPIVPVYLAIASKFFFTYKGKHIFNPGLMGVVLALLMTNEFISPAPAYQWNGIGSMSLFIIMPSLFLFMPRINRHWLVGSFLAVFTLQLVLRSVLIKHYLPFNTLFFGTITSPPFFLFCFFMITDPATTPKDRKSQIIVGVLLALFDLLFHLFKSYHTFFYAALLLGTGKMLWMHGKEAKVDPIKYFKEAFIQSGYYKKFFSLIGIATLGVVFYRFILNDYGSFYKTNFKMNLVPASQTGMAFSKGEIFEAVDPRVQHMGKWLLAITDGVAVADYDNDGLVDIFYTNSHKSKNDRNALFKNLGNFKFKRIATPDLAKFGGNFKKYGVASNAMFVDYDNDGDRDLYLTYAFGEEGTSRLFVNQLSETGRAEFIESTDKLGLRLFTNSATANFFDYNKDGKLDLIVGNTIATHLPNYDKPTRLNFLNLPQPQYEGDERMFDFMHDSWHMSNNGAENFIFVNGHEKFEKLDPKAIGMPETRWSMAIATADFNKDGWTDLYVANDFGADDLYYNQYGKGFKNIKGKYFGDVGKDTYKGMNATIGDFDSNGMNDVYISNVHHSLQAEGSLLYAFYPGDKFSQPKIKDVATFTGTLNENRFGWGASAKDFDNDGNLDLTQANGMVDNKYDARPGEGANNCPDYWYINEKIARSPPSIHRYINKWGDIRGMCIHGFEKNRMYLNRGVKARPQFIDIADKVGMNQVGNWRGMAAADFNNDGKMDLVVSSLYRNPLFFKNESLGNTNDWIGLRLESTDKTCNREGIGSIIKIHYLDENDKLHIQMRESTLVNGFSAQSDTRIHFGLGKKATITKVEIDWCNSKKKIYSNLDINQYNKVTL